MESRIVLSRLDVLRLRSLLARHQASADPRNLLDLEDEVERAIIVEEDMLPPDIVAIGSNVRVLDLQSGLHEHYVLVLPGQVDVARGRISVLAPLGTALIGCRVGDVVEWHMPGGLRRLRIEAVLHGEVLPAPPGSVAA